MWVKILLLSTSIMTQYYTLVYQVLKVCLEIKCHFFKNRNLLFHEYMNKSIVYVFALAKNAPKITTHSFRLYKIS